MRDNERHALGFVPLVLWGLLIGTTAIVSSGTLRGEDEKGTPREARKPVQDPVEPKIADVEDADGEPGEPDADATDEAGEATPPANPLGRIFGRLFEPRPGRTILPQPEDEIETERVMERRDRARDNIDLRAPQKLPQTKRLRTAERLIEEGNLDRAYEYLEAILGLRDPTLAPPEDSLVRSEDGQWVSIRWETNRVLGTLPEELLAQHRLAHGPEAAAQLAEARRENDLHGIAEVAMRYFQTEAGHEAANALASLHFERGEFGLAARWYSRLLEARSSVSANTPWRLKAAAAFYRSTQSERAEPILQQLRDDAEAEHYRIAGEPLRLTPWIAALDRTNRFETIPTLEDWPTPYGTPQRIGRHAGSSPLLVPRWQVVDAAVEDSSRRIGRQLEMLMLDLRDSGLPIIPSIQPIAVDGRVIYRTLGGVNVVDAETGRLLWETDRGVSPLVLLGAEAAEGERDVQTHVESYTGRDPDKHPLTNLLVRNGLWGTVSSDGDRLFVIEDQAVMFAEPQRGFGLGGQPNFGVRSIGEKTLDFSSNRITGYDLETGRPVWSVGGPRSDEPFAAPLEGVYFFGTPVAEGGELFAIGERHDEIRLISIDPGTGGENWSQLIALTDVDIDQDSARRTFSAQAAIGDGIIVCPTTVGWLVAVDRLNHTVVWAQRYSAAPNAGAQDEHVDEMHATHFRMLGQQWAASAPIIVGNRVVYSPEEEAAVYCFDLFDGHELWERTMQGHLYVAGVFDENVLLVGRDKIEAISVVDGRAQWAIDLHEPTRLSAPMPAAIPSAVPPMPVPMDHHGDHSTPPFGEVLPSDVADRVLPSGRGVFIGTHYHLPMTDGQLWSIDLQAGRLVSRSFLKDGEQPLGNLVVHRDGLYAASVFGLRAFEPRTRFEQLVAAGREVEASTLLKKAELHFLNRRHSAALTVLRSTPLEKVPADVREAYRKALIRALVEVVRRKPDSRTDVEQLGAISTTPEERLAFRRLLAERFEAIGNPEEAFTRFVELVDFIEVDARYSSGDHLAVRSTDWLAGRLADNWQALDETARKRVAPAVEQLAVAAFNGTQEDRRRFADMFAFHPTVVPVERRYVDEIAGVLPFGVVRNRLERGLLRSDDDGIVEEAERLLERLQSELSADVPAGSAAGPEWGDVDVELVQTRDYSSNEIAMPVVVPHPGRSPFVRGHRFVIHQQQNHFGGGHQIRRLEVTDARDGSRYWMPALRADDAGANAGVAVGRTADDLLFLSFMDVLTVLSPIDRRVVWTARMGNREQLSAFYRDAQQGEAPGAAMLYGPQITGENGVAARAARQGLLAVANGHYVCLHGRRTITVHDAATGAFRWQLDDVAADTQVFGSDELLVVVAPNGTTTVRRPRDGRIVERPEISDLVRRALEFDGDGIVVVENRAADGLLGLTGVKTVVRCWDIERKQDRWNLEFARNTGFVRLQDDALLAMTPQGEITTVDLTSGQRTTFESVPADVMASRSQVHALADAERIYMFVEKRGPQPHVMTDDAIPHFRFNGTVVAFDRRTGKRAWQHDVVQQALLLPGFADSPFVVFASRRYVSLQNVNYWMSAQLLLDKRTGRVLHEGTLASNNGYQSFNIDIAGRLVELRGYQGRSIFRVVPRRPEPVESATGETQPDQLGTDQSATGGTATEAQPKAREPKVSEAQPPPL